AGSGPVISARSGQPCRRAAPAGVAGAEWFRGRPAEGLGPGVGICRAHPERRGYAGGRRFSPAIRSQAGGTPVPPPTPPTDAADRAEDGEGAVREGGGSRGPIAGASRVGQRRRSGGGFWVSAAAAPTGRDPGSAPTRTRLHPQVPEIRPHAARKVSDFDAYHP